MSKFYYKDFVLGYVFTQIWDFSLSKNLFIDKISDKIILPLYPQSPPGKSSPQAEQLPKVPPCHQKKKSMYAIPNTSMQQVPESRILKSRPLILLSLSYQSQGQGQVSVYKMVIGVNYHPSPSGWTSRV